MFCIKRSINNKKKKINTLSDDHQEHYLFTEQQQAPENDKYELLKI